MTQGKEGTTNKQAAGDERTTATTPVRDKSDRKMDRYESRWIEFIFSHSFTNELVDRIGLAPRAPNHPLDIFQSK